MKFSPSTVAPTRCKIFGVMPSDPKSEYCKPGLIVDSSITGCMVKLFGGNSFLIFGGLGVLGLAPSTDVAAAAVSG